MENDFGIIIIASVRSHICCQELKDTVKRRLLNSDSIETTIILPSIISAIEFLISRGSVFRLEGAISHVSSSRIISVHS